MVMQDRREGCATKNVWDLCYEGERGRSFRVTVLASREVLVEDEEPLQLDRPDANEVRPRRESLSEIKAMIEQLVAKDWPEARLDSYGKSLTLSYKTRGFQIWRTENSGPSSESPLIEIGPQPGGLWLRVQEIDCPSWPVFERDRRSAYRQGYWGSMKDVYYLTDPRKAILAEWRLPTDMHPLFLTDDTGKMFRQLDEILGRRAQWPRDTSPPISLADALRMAEKSLRQVPPERYCYHARLVAPPCQDVHHGGWLLYFPASDGTQTEVTVRMDGKVQIDERYIDDEWVGSIYLNRWANLEVNHEFDRRDMKPGDPSVLLRAIGNRVAKLLAERSVVASVEVSGSDLAVKYKTTTYRVYPWSRTENGYAYSKELRDAVGPTADGFWLQARVVPKESACDIFDFWPSPPYYRSSVHVFNLDDWFSSLEPPDPVLEVELRMGNSEHPVILAREFDDLIQVAIDADRRDRRIRKQQR
jgi:hypothetical protein